MSIDESTVRKVAQLAAIEVDPEEIQLYTENLNEMLEYVDKLSQVNTEGVLATSHVHGSVNAFRDDITKPSLTSEQIESNAPDFAASSFRVPRIISSN